MPTCGRRLRLQNPGMALSRQRGLDRYLEDEHAMCVPDEHPSELDEPETVAPYTPAPFAPDRW